MWRSLTFSTSHKQVTNRSNENREGCSVLCTLWIYWNKKNNEPSWLSTKEVKPSEQSFCTSQISLDVVRFLHLHQQFWKRWAQPLYTIVLRPNNQPVYMQLVINRVSPAYTLFFWASCLDPFVDIQGSVPSLFWTHMLSHRSRRTLLCILSHRFRNTSEIIKTLNY